MGGGDVKGGWKAICCHTGTQESISSYEMSAFPQFCLSQTPLRKGKQGNATAAIPGHRNERPIHSSYLAHCHRAFYDESGTYVFIR